MTENERMMQQHEHMRKMQQDRKDKINTVRNRILSDIWDAVKQSSADAAFDVARLFGIIVLIVMFLTTLSLV